jgi:hypothetical protein
MSKIPAASIRVNLHWSTVTMTSLVEDGLWYHEIQEQAVLAGCRVSWWQSCDVWWVIPSRDVERSCSAGKPCDGIVCPSWYSLVACYSFEAIVEYSTSWLSWCRKAQIPNWRCSISDIGEVIVLPRTLHGCQWVKCSVVK